MLYEVITQRAEGLLHVLHLKVLVVAPLPVESAVLGYSAIGTVFTSVGGSNRNQFARTALEENYGHLHVVMSYNFV